MHASSSTSSSRPLPIAALVAVVLILCIEAFLYSRPDLTMPGLFIQVNDKHQRLMNTEREEDVIVMGDSRGFTIRPDVVSEALGGDLTVTNYSWPFFGVEAYEYFLRAYLAHRPPPKRIIVSLEPNLLCQPTENLLRQSKPIVTNRMYILLPFRSLVASLWRDGYHEILWDYFEYLCTPPSLKFRERLAQHLDTVSRGLGLTEFDEEDQRRVREQLEEGCFTIYASHVPTPEEEANFIAFMGKFKDSADPLVLERMERFLTLARVSGIEVVLLNGPISPTMRDLYTPLGILDQYEALVAGWESRFSNFRVIRPLFLDLPSDHFGDPAHVNMKGERAHREFYEERLRELRK